MSDYGDYINQEVAALNDKYPIFKRVKPLNGFRRGCPRCGFYCTFRGGTEGDCSDCVYCGTNTPDEYNMKRNEK